MHFSGVNKLILDKVWFEIESMLIETLKFADGKYSAQSVYDALLSEHMQLWVAAPDDKPPQAFAVTQIVSYPTKKIMLIMFAGGVKFNEWLPFIEYLKMFAMEHRCEAVEIYGRDGWKKKLFPYGFDQIHSVYRCTLAKDQSHEKNLDKKRFRL